MKRRTIIGGVIVGAALLGIGGGSYALGAEAQIPSQSIRTGPNVGDWCVNHGSNTAVYDWNQTACPAGTYDLSLVSAPTNFTLTVFGVTEDCVYTSVGSDGNQTDSIVCTGPTPTPRPRPTATVTVTTTPSASASSSPSTSPSSSPSPTASPSPAT